MSSFEVFLDDEHRLVRVSVKGEVFQSEGEKIITTARQKATELEYNILCDMRAATTTVNFVSWYKLPRELEVFNRIDARRTKTAVVVSKKDKALEGYQFYEAVMDNLGFRLRVFFDEARAIEWLTGS